MRNPHRSAELHSLMGTDHKPDAGELSQLLREARRRQELIADFAKDALQNIDLDRLLHEAVLRVSQGVRIDRVKIMRYQPETADLLVIEGVGWREGVVGRTRLKTDMASPPGRAFQTAQPVLIDDLPASTEFRYQAVLKEHGIVSLVNVPIFVDGAAWGVLEADSSLPRDVTSFDADFLSIFARILGSAIQRKHAEAEASAAAARAATLAADREVLLRELQHRVKNNLQMILGLISMQQKKVTDPQAKRAFTHIADRVAAIALAQDQLSAAAGMGEVKIGAYLRALCGYIAPEGEGVVITAEAQDLDVPIDQAVPAGLIVNEAVTNALKHAFPDQRHGRIHVTFAADARLGEAVLRVADDGVGLGPPRDGGSGRDLIHALASQLSGELEARDAEEGGTIVEVRFPLRLARAEQASSAARGSASAG
jgi:two-component sensor histidine kinase